MIENIVILVKHYLRRNKRNITELSDAEIRRIIILYDASNEVSLSNFKDIIRQIRRSK